MITIPGYKVTGTIYEGAKSIVYRGHREKDNLPVVVKIQKSDYPSPKNIAKFRWEYHIGKMLDFNGVIKYYRMEKYKTDHALILEDFGGVALEEVIPSSGMNVSTFLWVAIQLAQALDEVHKKQIIHKDIKPRNIVINTETKVAKLIDFGISSQLSQENQTVLDPNMLEGTLAYMSPEQTGRMNRKADYRSDFYSLGVTFYQMLTSQVPFQSTDPMELVHCHIAVPPPALTELNPEIPKAISDVVMKLLSKTAEDRYQSVYGLIVDLETCLSQFASSGKIEDFVPGKSDVSSKFQIPQKLYGRGQEIEMLLAAFDRVSQGTKEMMFVSGYSGIGKSALVNEIHKPIVRQRGYFISGKIDQFQRNIPYASFIQAFQNLIRQLLTENETQIAAWNEKLRFALGPNGQIIIDVIPEVELIIGKQPPVPELPTAEAQNRFNLVFQNFVRTFTQKEHPLAIFLDDLQWADSPSLSLIELLMSDSSTQHLFLIGAYRDNEVTPAHPLMLTIDEMKKKETVISEINLRPLDMESLNQLTADTLNCEVKRSEPLAELVMGKTGGNPFFATQFLRSIYDEGLLIFDAARDGWQWEFAKIQEVGITDNVVELMAGKIQKLQANTQQILQLAACIGNQFDLQTLAIVHEKSQLETARHLWEAAQEGLIFPIGDAYKFIQEDIVEHVESTVSYKFLHDRVQQAAYSLISEDHKKEVHLKIGRLLLDTRSTDELEEHIFELVGQLNKGIELITKRQEKDRLMDLNLIAGKQAKESTAYESALKHFAIAMDLLEESCWESRYHFTFDLYRERAECEFLHGNYERADDFYDILLNRAQSKLDQANVDSLRTKQYTQIGKWEEAIETSIEGLGLFGTSVPLDNVLPEIEKELEEIEKNMAGRKIEDLIHSPELTNLEKLAEMRLLLDMAVAAYVGGRPDLFGLTVIKAANIALRYGNGSLSAYTYAMYSLVLLAFGDFSPAYEFAKLGMDSVEKFQALQFKCIATYLYSVANYWHNHFKTSLPLQRAAYRIGLETGDLEWAGYAYNNLIMTRFAMGDELESVMEESDKSYSFAQETRNFFTLDSQISYRQIIRSLQGKTKDKCSLSDDNFDEAEWLRYCEENNAVVGFFWYYLAKMQLFFYYEDYTQAYRTGMEAEKYLGACPGFVPVGEHGFRYSVAMLGYCRTVSADEKKEILENFEPYQDKLKLWSDTCPDNYLHKYLLVEAELARNQGRNEEAMRLYKRSIQSASRNGFTQNEALANELAAQFYLAQGFEEIAQIYIREARYGYLRWGATAKVLDLDERYPQLLGTISVETRTVIDSPTTHTMTETSSTTEGGSSALDLNTIMKGCQAIATEILLEKVLERLMKIVIENAGAQKGLLILEEDGNLFIEAEGAVNKNNVVVLQSIPIETSQDLSVAIINYTMRTRENVVLNDATHEGMFTTDAYITQKQPRSILCTPLINQGKLSGILYLENNLTTSAFTPDRLEVLNLLSSQAAISIENARLYANLAQSEARFRTLVEHAPEAIVVLDVDTGLFVDVNDNAVHLYGHKREALMKMGPIEMSPPTQPDGRSSEKAAQEKIQQALDGIAPIFDWVHRNAMGDDIPCEVRLVRLPATGRNFVRASIIDITERKKAEQLLADYNRTLEQEVKARTQELSETLEALRATQTQLVEAEKMASLGGLVAGIAHEINTPVGIGVTAASHLEKNTQVFVETYKSGGMRRSDLEKYLSTASQSSQMILSNLNRAAELIQSFKQVAVDQLSEEQRIFGVKVYLEEIVNNYLRPELKRTSHEIAIHCDENLTLDSYPGALSQVVTNLVMNSLTHAYEAGEKGRLVFDIKQVNERTLVFEYSDNGVGISEEHLNQIFDPFFTTKRAQGGSGLGLHLVYNIVTQKLNGTIRCESELGVGTKFIIELPIQNVAESSEESFRS